MLPSYENLFPPHELERLNRELQIRQLQGTPTAGLQNQLRQMMIQAIRAQGEQPMFQYGRPTVGTAVANFPTYMRQMEGKTGQADIGSILQGKGLLPRREAGTFSARQPSEPQPTSTEVNQVFNVPAVEGTPEEFAQREAIKARYFKRRARKK